MHDNPQPTEEEHEAALDPQRQRDEEDMRYPSPGNENADEDE